MDMLAYMEKRKKEAQGAIDDYLKALKHEETEKTALVLLASVRSGILIRFGSVSLLPGI